MSYDTNISMGPNVSMGTPYNTVGILRHMIATNSTTCLVVATSYDSYQAEHGEGACLAVLASTRALVYSLINFMCTKSVLRV